MKAVDWNHGNGFEWRDKINPDEALRFADGRVALLGTKQNLLTVDNQKRRLADMDYKFLYTLVQSLDTVVTYPEIVSLTYGWKDPSTSTVDSFLRSMRLQVHRVRNELGAELGDPDYGAIRVNEGLGYTALSTLDT